MAGLRRLGELQVVNATCPPESVDKDGFYVAPTRPNKLLCSFKMAGLVPMDGAITPLVYVSGNSSTPPLPAKPTTYRIANAPRVEMGQCATLSASQSLRQEGGDGADSAGAVEGQPRLSDGQVPIPTRPVCNSLSTSSVLTFGPFKSTQCGSYMFQGTVSARPYNASRSVRASAGFPVDVTGCSGQQQQRSQAARRSGTAGRRRRRRWYL